MAAVLRMRGPNWFTSANAAGGDAMLRAGVHAQRRAHKRTRVGELRLDVLIELPTAFLPVGDFGAKVTRQWQLPQRSTPLEIAAAAFFKVAISPPLLSRKRFVQRPAAQLPHRSTAAAPA